MLSLNYTSHSKVEEVYMSMLKVADNHHSMESIGNLWSNCATQLIQRFLCMYIFLPARLSFEQPTATSMPPRHHGRLLASHWLRHLVGLGRDSRPTDMLALAASTDYFIHIFRKPSPLPIIYP